MVTRNIMFKIKDEKTGKIDKRKMKKIVPK